MDDIPNYPGTPRWVKVFALIVLVVIIAIALVLHTRSGGHGPRRHVQPVSSEP